MKLKILQAMSKHIRAAEKCKTLEELNRLIPSFNNIMNQCHKLNYITLIEKIEFSSMVLMIKRKIIEEGQRD